MKQKNSPALWKNLIPKPRADGHKYDRGHALIYGAPELTGATRLAAQACARMGVGLVTVLAPASIVNVYRTALPAHIMARDDLHWWDERVTARLYGSGGMSAPVDGSKNVPTVLDADALAEPFRQDLQGYVLTPHEGEFARIFPDITGDREARAGKASQKTGAVVVFKGAQTIIAAPDRRLIINDHASPYLASAGTGDVLAGMITGLIAQGMKGFEAAAAAVWIHGECSVKIGAGLVAGDIEKVISGVLKDIL